MRQYVSEVKIIPQEYTENSFQKVIIVHLVFSVRIQIRIVLLTLQLLTSGGMRRRFLEFGMMKKEFHLF